MTIRETRYRRLLELIEEAGGIVELSETTQVSEKYLRQILNGFQGTRDRQPRSVGSNAARRLEAGMSKPPGWMDKADSEIIQSEHAAPPLSDEALRVARSWDKLPKEVRQNIIELMDFTLSAVKMLERASTPKKK